MHFLPPAVACRRRDDSPPAHGPAGSLAGNLGGEVRDPDAIWAPGADARLNRGEAPDDIFHAVSSDPELASRPYLLELYDHPKFIVRNLIRQAKVEQVYSIMQTGTSRGMMTLEQSLADLVLRGVIDQEMALSRSSRAEQLLGLIQRNSLEPEQQLAAASGLRVAGA